MKLQQFLITKYLSIPYDDFSHRAMLALAILTSIANNPLDNREMESKKKLFERIKRVNEIIDTTRDNVQVNLFVLDRNISPQDNAKTILKYKTTFRRKKRVGDSDTITLSADEIQSHLCYATMEINQIMVTELASFSDQISFETLDL